MDIMMTKALATISQALSPLLGTGVGAAASAAGAWAAAAAAGAVAVAACASTAGLSSAHAPPDKPTAHTVSRMAKNFFMMQLSLQGIGAGFPGADADGLFEQIGADGRLDLHLGQEIDHILGAPVQLGVTLLTAETLDLGDGNALHADGGEGFPHFVELEGLDDGGNELHGCFLSNRRRDAARSLH